MPGNEQVRGLMKKARHMKTNIRGESEVGVLGWDFVCPEVMLVFVEGNIEKNAKGGKTKEN